MLRGLPQLGRQVFREVGHRGVIEEDAKAQTEHFQITMGMVEGKTEIGKVTARLLQMNAPRRVQLRRSTSG